VLADLKVATVGDAIEQARLKAKLARAIGELPADVQATRYRYVIRREDVRAA